MRSNILPIAVASVTSLLAGVTLTLVFAAGALEAVPDDRSDALFDVAQEVRTAKLRIDRMEKVLQRELGATRRDIHQALAAGDRPRPANAATPAEPTSGGVVAAQHATRDAATAIPAKSVAALGPLADWKSDASVRSEWLFATESASLAAFGAPDEVSVRGTAEVWTYWNVAGETIASEYRLQFNNGRLVRGSLVEWKKPRALPTARR